MSTTTLRQIQNDYLKDSLQFGDDKRKALFLKIFTVQILHQLQFNMYVSKGNKIPP